MIALLAVALTAVPPAYIVRTNVPELRGRTVEVGEVLTLPRATPEKDFWLTIRYYSTCAEDTHINSRDDEEIRVVVKDVPPGDCNDPIWR